MTATDQNQNDELVVVPTTTIDLNQLVLSAVTKAVEGGAVAAAIDAGVQKTIEEIVGRATRSYSPFGEALEEAITATLQIQAGDLGLSGYNQMVLSVIRAKLDAIVDEQLREKFAADLEALLIPAPKEIHLSKLIRDFKVWAKNEVLTDSYCCTVKVERTEYKSHWVYLDPKSNKSNYNCRFRFLISGDGSIFSLSDQGQDMKNVILSKQLRGFPRDLFQMMAAGTKISIDEEEPSDRFGDDEYEED